MARGVTTALLSKATDSVELWWDSIAARTQAGKLRQLRCRCAQLDAPHARLAATRLARNPIVRWKKAGQPTDWETSRIRVMSLGKTAVGIVVIAVVAVGAYYFVHERSAQAERVVPVAPAAPVSVPAEAPAPPLASGAVAASPSVAAPATAAGAKAAPAGDPGLPLKGGEVLEFTADVAKVSNVATLELQTVEKRNFYGKNAWHLQALAHTQNPLRMVFELDDQFDSYSDASTMTSMQYEMHLSERGQKVTSVQHLTSTGRDAASPNAVQTHVLPGTRDPLGMMQYLRHVDWTKTQKVEGPVYDGHKLYDVIASLAGSGQSVSVPAGNYSADKVEIRVFDNGQEMKDAHFFVYFAKNEARTPVLLEAEMPFASARVALKSVK